MSQRIMLSSSQRKGELSLLFLTMIWGTTFIVTRTALSDVTPFVLLAMRFTIGFLVLFIVFFRRMLRVTRHDVWAGAVLGVMFFSGNALQTSGLQYTSAGVSGFITALSVVMVPGIALVVLRERPRLSSLAGVVLATVGLALLSLSDTLMMSYGDLLTVGCAVAFAFHVVYINKYGYSVEPTVMVAVQLLLSALAAFALAALTEDVRPLTQGVVLAAGYLGLMATAFAFLMQVYGQRLTTATRSALIYTMEPVFAASFAYLAVGELLTPRGLVGCGFILGGMLVAELL